MLKGTSIFISLKEYVIITLGMLLYIVGWSVFLVPNQLVGGGVSGLASVVQYATNGAVKMGYTYFVVNVVLLIIAMFILGNKFGFKTIYAIVIASVGLNVFQEIIPADICQTLAVENGKLMSSIMGGLMAGVGIGLCMSQGGSTGGTDIIALIVNKYRNVSPGKMILAMDVVIILSSLLVPIQDADGSIMQFNEKITTCVYGFILIVVNGTVLDMVIAGTRQSVQLFILSKKHKEIADAITNDLHRGVTVLNGMGWYTKEPTEVLMVLTRKYDLNVLLRYIKNIDPEAFLSVSTVTGVYGKGFESIKTGRKK
ncbi:MAG: YitT family protein [Bacteroidales bacterium]|nr:YitT family protein [Bacteroidales bacterium]MEE0340045.1 YitT family protein [Bacteroidales bacterium]